MPQFSNDAELVKTGQPGEYLFKIYEINDKTSQAGNDYWQIKFRTKDDLKVCDNFMFNGKAASKTLFLLTALGFADGKNFPKNVPDKEDILGSVLYITVVKDTNSDFLKCPFNASGYKEYKSEKKNVKKSEPPKAEVIGEDIIPF